MRTRSKKHGKKRGLFSRLRKVPHLYQKSIIAHCLVVLTIAAYYSLYQQAHGADMTPLFTAIGAVFCTELTMCLLKTIFKKELKEEEKDDEPSI